MGKILMSFLFQKSNYLHNELSHDGKREYHFYGILSAILLIITALPAWEAFYEFSNILGSLSCNSPQQALAELFRMLPLSLLTISLIYMALYVIVAYRAKSLKSRINTWRINGYITIILGSDIAAYVIIGVLNGEYASFIEGYITPLFPLDNLILGLIIIIYGILAVSYSEKLKKNGSSLPYTNSSNILGFRRCTLNPFMIYPYLTALGGLAATIYSIRILDFSHRAVFYNILLIANYIIAPIMYVVYRYVYIEVKPAFRVKTSRILGLTFFATNVVCFALFLFAVQLYPDAPNSNAFGLLPLDFTAGMNAFGVIYGVNNIVTPFIAILHTEKPMNQ